jgi:hypothetical protein
VLFGKGEYASSAHGGTHLHRRALVSQRDTQEEGGEGKEEDAEQIPQPFEREDAS